jgi:hypothetical protein
MDKIKSSEVGELKSMLILEGLTDELKDPQCFEPIEKKIWRIMKSDHTHRTISGFNKCKRCQVKRAKRNTFIKETGFKNYEQYLKWRQIMSIIRNKKDFAI